MEDDAAGKVDFWQVQGAEGGQGVATTEENPTP